MDCFKKKRFVELYTNIQKPNLLKCCFQLNLHSFPIIGSIQEHILLVKRAIAKLMKALELFDNQKVQRQSNRDIDGECNSKRHG